MCSVVALIAISFLQNIYHSLHAQNSYGPQILHNLDCWHRFYRTITGIGMPSWNRELFFSVGLLLSEIISLEMFKRSELCGHFNNYTLYVRRLVDFTPPCIRVRRLRRNGGRWQLV